jgi:heme exporter protein A
MLSTHELSCQRGRQQLWSHLNLSIAPGEIAFIKGANGSGKSSLLRILAGLSSPSDGEICWHGHNIRKCTDTYRAELLYIGHQTPLKPELSAIENLLSLTQLHGLQASLAEITKALSIWELQGKTIGLATKQLSQGQKQRVSLAQLSLLKKSVWILDEPFNSLDAAGSRILSQHLEEHLLTHKKMVVITSHVHDNAAQIAASLSQIEQLIQF